MLCYYYEYIYAGFLSFLPYYRLLPQSDIAIRSIIYHKDLCSHKNISTYLERLCYTVTYPAAVVRRHLH